MITDWLESLDRSRRQWLHLLETVRDQPRVRPENPVPLTVYADEEGSVWIYIPQQGVADIECWGIIGHLNQIESLKL